MDLKIVPPDLTAGIEQRLQQGEKLKSGAQSDEKTRKNAQKVAREFEAVFTGFMIKSMRETVGKDKLTGGGRGEEIYQSLLDQEYALAIAQQGSLGLAKTIEKQLLNKTGHEIKQPGNAPQNVSDPNGGG